MKTVLRIAPHAIIPGAEVVELWYRGQLIGTVTGADGPGIRVVSKYQKDVVRGPDSILQVSIDIKTQI